MHALPTIQRRAEPPVAIAPYATMTVHAAPEAGMSDVRPLVERWTGAGNERTESWEAFAAENHLVGYNAQPVFRPDYAYCARHRWVAIIQEAPGEMHVYAGLCAVTGAELPAPAAVAERATALIHIFTECRIHRGRQRIRLQIAGSMHVRGSPSGYEYHARKGYLAVFGESDTLKEALPLFVASYGGLFSSGPPNKLPMVSYATTLVVGVMAFCFLALMRWITALNQSRWISTGWPQ